LGCEYHRVNKFFWDKGVIHCLSCPQTSAQNGITEHKHKLIIEEGIALLAHSPLPVCFWDEVFLTRVYLINHMPNALPPFSLFHEWPDYSLLRSFGSLSWPNLRPYNNHKHHFRSRQCVFLGYSSMHKGKKS
jgi:histone deacetylase 1/2